MTDRTPSEGPGAGDASTPSPPPELLHALVEEAAKKSSVLWLSYPGSGRARPAWHVWHEGAAYVVAAGTNGSATDAGDEQELPGLAEAENATVTMRAKDSQARLVTWTARVTRVEPGTGEWETATRQLRSSRLNATDQASLPERWARTAVVVRLEPTGEIPEYPGAMPSHSAAAPPPETPAVTGGRLPWVLHRRPRRSRRLW